MKPTSAFLSMLFAANAFLEFAAAAQTRSSSEALRGRPVARATPENLAHSLVNLDPNWWRATTPTTTLNPPSFVPGANASGGRLAASLQIETCTPFLNMPGTFVATKEYWATACKSVPLNAQYIRLTAGDVVDYFKPKPGKSICDMLTSSDQHYFSSGGVEWVEAQADLESLKYLGGGGTQWFASLKLPNDKREAPSSWGVKAPATQTGGCCHSDYQAEGKAWGQAFRMEYCGMPQELAPICTPLTTVAGSFNANKDFWAETCKPIPMTAGYVKIDMGTSVDYFRPPTGKSYCDMLTSNNVHKWSKDGETWVDPKYVDEAGADKDGLGGSSAPGDALDKRTKISFWGSNVLTSTGGCCFSGDTDAAPGFGKGFFMSYCEIAQATPVSQLVESLHNTEKSVIALETSLSNLHNRLNHAERVNVDASGNVSLARSGMYKLAVKAKGEADDLALFTAKASIYASNLDTAKTEWKSAEQRVRKDMETSRVTKQVAENVASPAGLQHQEDLNAKIWKLMDPANKQNLAATESLVRSMEKNTDKFMKQLRGQVKTVMVTRLRRTVGKMRKVIHRLGTVGNKVSDGTLGQVESSAPLGADLGLNDD